jgi:putative heme transporter
VLIVAVAVLAVAYVLANLLLVVMPFIVALLLASVLVPVARWIEERGVHRLLSTVIVVVGMLAALVGAIVLIAPAVAQEFGDLGETLEEGWASIRDWVVDNFDLTEDDIDGYVDQGFERVRDQGEAIAGGLLAGAILALEVIAGFILTVVLLFFFVKDGDKICNWLLHRLDPVHHEAARRAGRKAWMAGGGYIRGSAIVATVDAIGIGLGMIIVGVPLVIPIMILTFFGGFFPIVGATVAGGLAILVALVTLGPLEALLIFGVVLAVQQTESNILEPVVMAKAVLLHPVVILVVLTAGAIIGGLAGAFLAVPTTAVLTVVIGELRAVQAERDPTRRPHLGEEAELVATRQELAAAAEMARDTAADDDSEDE